MNIPESLLKAGTILAAGFALFAASSASAQQSRLCDVDQVAVFENRIHVKCAPIESSAYTKDITYYAMATSQPKVVIDNIIALAVGAKVTRKPLRIWLDFSDYRSVPGCQGSDCRKLVAAALE